MNMRTPTFVIFGQESVRKLGLLLLVSALFCSPGFAGAVYKCVAEDGSIVYQDTPCCEEESEEEISFPEFLNGDDGKETVHADSIRALKKKADIQYLERKIKESERRIDSLMAARQTKIDYWRGVMMFAKEEVQVVKIENIIDKVTDDYNRRIEKEQKRRDALEERLSKLK